MGTRASKEEVKAPHFYFKEVAVKNEFNKQLITCFQPLMRMDDCKDWETKYNLAMSMNKDSLLLAESFEKERIKKFFACCECPADIQMAITFQRFDHMFKSEILKRKSSSKFYSEQELFLIFYNFLQGAKEFQVRGLDFGDIRSGNIVITSNKQLKMISVASFPWEKTSIQKILDDYDNSTIFYLAPEEINYIQSKGALRGHYPNAKTEAFSIGLTILQAALLQDSQSLYAMPSRSLNQTELYRRIKKVGERYPKLMGYLQNIVKTKIEERLSSGQAWALLRPYSEKITQIKAFSQNMTAESDSLKNFRSQSTNTNASPY